MQEKIIAFCEKNDYPYKPIGGLLNIKCKNKVGHKIRIDIDTGYWDCLKKGIESQPYDEHRIKEEIEGKSNNNVNLALYNADEIELKELKWLWYPYIPANKMTIVQGDPGIGKSFAVIDVCARVSTGAAFPYVSVWRDNEFHKVTPETRKPANVMYCSNEDGADDTILPRFINSGGDLSRLKIFKGEKKDNDYEAPFNFTDKIYLLEEAIKRTNPAIVVFDPLQSFIGVDMNKANETRPALFNIVQLAERYEFSAIIIRHLNKGGKDKALYRGMGSMDIDGTARSVITIGKNPQDPKLFKTWTQTKLNVAKEGESLDYTICGKGKVEWGGVSDLNSEQVLGMENGTLENDRDERKFAMEEAIDYLYQMFRETKEVESELLVREAKRLGITESTLKKARQKMKCFSSEKRGSKWFTVWSSSTSKNPHSDEEGKA